MSDVVWLGIVDCFRFFGYYVNIEDWFVDVDVFIFVLDYEGLGNVVVEVLVVGVLIVVIDCCVNMVLLVDGVGLFVLM